MSGHDTPACTCSRISGGASRVPLHLGYLLQPRKKPRRLGRSFIGALHSGQVSVTSTCGTAFFAGAGSSRFSSSFSSSGTCLVLRQRGKALQPRNGPRGPRRIFIGSPHFSHLMPGSMLSGLPSASTSLAFLHLG